MNSGLREGDFTSLKALQNQVYVDVAIDCLANPSNDDILDKESNELLEGGKNNNYGLLCSASISNCQNVTSIYFGTANSFVGKMKLHSQQEDDAYLEILELAIHNENNTDNAIAQIATSTYFASSDVVFVLDKSGCLHILCLHTLLEIFSWKEETVVDFVLLDEGQGLLNLLMVSERANAKDEKITDTYLQIREYPSFRLIYELKVNKFCKPLSSAIGQESPVVIEGSFPQLQDQNDVELNKTLAALRIRGICEGNAEIRLERLLRRNKFEEAETCARLNGLDFEKIYQGKSSWLLAKLSPWNSSNIEGKSIEGYDKYILELRNTLENMSNLEYMVRCCVGAALPSLKDTRNVLLLARNVIQKHLNENNFDQNLLSSISFTLQRLETFIYTHHDHVTIDCGTDQEKMTSQSKITSHEIIDKWASFNRADMLVRVGQFISQEKISAALLVWQRHQAEFSERLTLEHIRTLLNLIKPEDNSFVSNGPNHEKMFRWLSQFIPDCLRILPECLPIIADWTVTATKRLELRDRRNWPSNGIKLATSSLEAMHLCNGNYQDNYKLNSLKSTRIPLTLHQQRTDKTSNLYNLTNLVESLFDLTILHGELKIRIRLDDFIQEDKYEVCTQLLDWCTSSEEVKLLLDKFMVSYIKRFRLDQTKVLASYCENMITDTGFCWYWELGSTAPWEDKVETIVHYLSNSPIVQANLILETLKYAPVPWSTTIKKLCEVGYNLPQSNLVKEQEKLVDLKYIARKYNCRNFSVSGREAEAILKKVIRSGGSYEEVSLIANLLHGLNETSAKKFYIQHLLENSWTGCQHNEAIQIILKTSNHPACFDEVLELATQFLIRAKLLYKLDFDVTFCNSKADGKCEFVSASPYLLLLKGLICNIRSQFSLNGNHQQQVEELELMINRFVNTCVLRMKFGIQLSESCTKEDAENVVNIKVNQLINEDPKCDTTEDLSVIYKKLQELVMLTKPLACTIRIENVISMVIILLVKGQKYDMAVKATELLIGSKTTNAHSSTSTTSQDADTLVNLILHVNRDIAHTDKSVIESNKQFSFALPTIMAYLASYAVNTCREEQIIDNVFVSKWQALMANISRQFHSKTVFDKFQDGVNFDGSELAFDIWKFSPVFVDKTLPLPDYSALLAPAKFMTMLLCQKEKARPYMPQTMFCNKGEIWTKQAALEAKVDKKRNKLELLDSTAAVCALTPPLDRTVSPVQRVVSFDSSFSSIEREETLNTLSSEIMQHCHHCLNPMNQTILALESLILADATLTALSITLSDSSNRLSSMFNASKLQDMMVQECLRLLPKILSDKKPDLMFALGLILLNDDTKKGLKLLQKTNSAFGFDDADKVKSLGRVGVRYCAITKLTQRSHSFRKLLIRAVWSNKLASVGGSYKAIFTINTQADKIKVLQSLIERNDAELKFLGVVDVLQYSKALELDNAPTLVFYIRSLLTSSLVEPRVEADNAPREEIKSNFNKQFAENISVALSNIPDNERHEEKLKLISKLFLAEVSPYNYEVLLFLLHAWGSVLQKGMDTDTFIKETDDGSLVSNDEETFLVRKDTEERLISIARFERMLEFLFTYQRTEEPSSDEIEYWHKARPGTAFPLIAKRRLPFNYLSEKSPKETFKYLMKEFKLENLNQWLRSANEEKFVFRHSPNNICIQTAQNEITNLVQQSVNETTHHSSWLEKLGNVEECLSRITDLFQATSLTHWIINRLPEHKGDERLFCARMCRKFAEAWKQQAGNHDQATQKGFNFAVTTQIRLEIEQILRRNNLLDEPKKQVLQEFQQLESSKLVELVVSLYEHPSIVERSQNILYLQGSQSTKKGTESVCYTKMYPNINQAAKEIASVTNHAQSIFEINLDVIKYDLLDALLKEKPESRTCENNFDETVTSFHLNLLPGNCDLEQSDNSQDDENANYLRCVYLLQGFENRKGFDYLLQIAMHDEDKTSVDIDMTTTHLNVATSNVSTMHKLRSLKCLLSVARQDELDEMGCGIFEEEHFIEKRFHNYGFVSRLELLNLPAYDIASFETCDKSALIEGILRICSYSAKGKNDYILQVSITWFCPRID